MEMTVGELAHRAGVGVETVRFYERRGLLDQPTRAPNGYRLYGPDTLARLALIARAKGLGFTLAEIADLTDAADAEEVLDRAQLKIAHVDTQLAELEALRDRLVSLTEVCASDDVACTSLEV
jgi:MerR family transcriptional regulator, copper efflux regulator